jgi:hypothetical protein
VFNESEPTAHLEVDTTIEYQFKDVAKQQPSNQHSASNVGKGLFVVIMGLLVGRRRKAVRTTKQNIQQQGFPRGHPP